MSKKLFALLSLALVAIFTLAACSPTGYVSPAAARQNATVPTTAPAAVASNNNQVLPTAAPVSQPNTTANDGLVLDPQNIGSEPENGANVDDTIWKQPLKTGSMIGENGDVYYTQTGKNGERALKGTVPAGMSLVLDAYTVWIDGKVADNGNVLAWNAGEEGIDLSKHSIVYKDGGANLVPTSSLQAFLNDNTFGKFCRGNIAPDGKSFTYVPWALKHIQLPTGITFPSMSSCPKSTSQDKTTIPALQ